MNSTEHTSLELPVRSKFIATASAWRIANFSQKNFDDEGFSYREGHRLDGLRSPGQRYSVTCKNQRSAYEFHAWLSCDVEDGDGLGAQYQRSPWLTLTLTTTDDWFLKISGVPEDDRNNLCSAWIVGTGAKRECISRLSGGVHSGSASEYTFRKPQFVLYEDVINADKGLLVDDQLTIVFEIRAVIDSWLFHPLQESEVTEDSDHTLLKDIKRMLESGHSSDVTLVANDGEEFAAHMSILASRSPVFAAMFKTNMKEKLEKRVEIKDLNAQTVKNLLEFAYTDAVTDASLLLDEQLLYAAHKYHIPGLKMSCEEAMAANLKTENAAELLSMGHEYNAARLLRAAKHFIVGHIREVRKTQGWKKLLGCSPDVVEEIVDELADLAHQLTSSE